MFVLDSHCDTPSQIFRLRDLSLDNTFSQVDFPKLKRGGVDGAFFALYIPSAMDSDSDKGLEYSRKLLNSVKSTVAANSDKAAFAVNAEEAERNKKSGRFSVFLGLENGSPIGCSEKSFDILQEFYNSGVRYITLCHSGNNQICDSCSTSYKKWGGLSPFGRELIAEMNRIGILVDVSHISDDSFFDVLKCSSKPVVATHSCCRSLSDHPRNMTDEMILALAAAGGVIQINFYPLFLNVAFQHVLKQSGIIERGELIEQEFIADPSDLSKRMAWNQVITDLQSLDRPSYTLIADHIDHVVDLVGIDHVGIGSDFDGIEVTPCGMEDVSMMPKLFEELRNRGYSYSDLEKISSGNFFRVLGA